MSQQIVIEKVNLLDLPSMPLAEKHLFPPTPCIYFVVTSECEVLYIGRAVNLKSRWINHHRHETLSTVSGVTVVWIEIRDIEQLAETERQAIKHFQPKFNNQPITVPTTKSQQPYLDAKSLIKVLTSKIAEEVRSNCAVLGERYCNEMFRLGITTENTCRTSSDYDESRSSLGKFAARHSSELMKLLSMWINKGVEEAIQSVLESESKDNSPRTKH